MMMAFQLSKIGFSLYVEDPCWVFHTIWNMFVVSELTQHHSGDRKACCVVLEALRSYLITASTKFGVARCIMASWSLRSVGELKLFYSA